jgi:hypothetical protein
MEVGWLTVTGLMEYALRRATSPLWYLAGLGGGMVAWLWLQRGHFGIVLPLLLAAGILVLLGLLGTRHPHPPPQGGRDIPWRTRWWLLCALVLTLAVGGMASIMVHRQQQGLTIEYDGFAQDEVAVDRLLHGHPIYGVSWAGTEVDGFAYIYNGIDLRHYNHLPLTVLPGVPIKLATDGLGLPFDYRMVTLLFLLAGIGAVMALPVGYVPRFLVLVGLFFNPMLMTFTLTGHDDICFVAMVMLTLVCLARRHPVLAALAAGAAAASKPFGALVIPVLIIANWPSWREQWPRRRSELLACLAALMAVPVVTVLPFILWNPGAFWREMLFTTGGIADSYPISGFGFGALLVWLHVLRPDAAFPFTLLEVLAVGAVLVYAGRHRPRNPSMEWFMGVYVAAFLAFAFFSRYFVHNYVGAFVAMATCVVPLRGAPLLPQAASSESRAAA